MTLQFKEKMLHLVAVLGILFTFAGAVFGLTDASTDPYSITYWRGSVLICTGVSSVVFFVFSQICSICAGRKVNAQKTKQGEMS